MAGAGLKRVGEQNIKPCRTATAPDAPPKAAQLREAEPAGEACRRARLRRERRAFPPRDLFFSSNMFT
jgi:hypothetical protein